MKGKFTYLVIYTSVAITTLILVSVLAYTFIQGINGLTWDFISNTSHEQVEYVKVDNIKANEISYTNQTTYLDVSAYSGPKALDDNQKEITLPETFEISTINGEPVTYMDEKEISQELLEKNVDLKVKLSEVGILSEIVSTLITIGVALAFSLPVGIISAIYLVEYLQKGRLYKIIHFAIDSLAGIPSIIFGLFGLLLFSQLFGLGISLLSGSLTVAIMLLPTIIRTTEEALLAVDQSYREASLALGATKLQTIFKIVLPNAVGGIIVAIILAIGRIIGESAILIFTAGTVDKMPASIFDSSATLTVKAYILTKEYGDIATASTIGLIVITIIIILNITAKLIAKRFNRYA